MEKSFFLLIYESITMNYIGSAIIFAIIILIYAISNREISSYEKSGFTKIYFVIMSCIVLFGFSITTISTVEKSEKKEIKTINKLALSKNLDNDFKVNDKTYFIIQNYMSEKDKNKISKIIEGMVENNFISTLEYSNLNDHIENISDKYIEAYEKKLETFYEIDNKKIYNKLMEIK